jgi:hypothetical protein
VRQVGQAHEQLGQAGVLGLGLGLELADFLFLFSDKGAEAGELGLVATRLGLADLFLGGVALGLRGLGRGDLLAPYPIYFKDFRRHARQPPPRHRGVERLRIVADEADVVHRGLRDRAPPS